MQVAYTAGGTKYGQETFAPARGMLAGHGAVSIRFAARKGPGRVTVRVAEGRTGLARFGRDWAADEGKTEHVAVLKPDQSAELVGFTRPMEAQPKAVPAYDEGQKACAEIWNALLDRGARFEVPEPVVRTPNRRSSPATTS